MFRHAMVTGALLFGLLGLADQPRAAEPQRIVSVGGALTEILFRLDVQDRLVGVDTTSQWPSEAEALPQVGYQRALAAEGLLSLSPDLVLATEAAGPPAVIEQIRATGVEVRIIHGDPSPEGLVEKIRAVAEAVGRPAAGAALAEEVAEKMRRVEARLGEVSDRPSVVFLLSAARGSPMAAGRDTAADAAIRLAAGLNPLAAEMVGYKPLNTESMIGAAPDVILLTDRTLEGLGGIEGVLALPGVSLTPAGRHRRIAAMDDLYLLGFGPRLPAAIADLAAELHPRLAPETRLGLGRMDPSR
ncbi:heme/hemin ABC transporter substrate-binding protein [Thiocapsa rosea]|uniref:Iron complex transport system substrate-binding protein n=1 Tax=Thiocapsa rosea TaxID=69360 RepID=A0A495V7S2_9GAMM|nr:ABC transporter substrate-binding protein [Thiocapsa rosea]RKT44663.1 iron complex transport system substrate-binding protein [Thiocapsa rosea]